MFHRKTIEDAFPNPVVATPIAHYTRIGTIERFVGLATSAQAGWTSAWATPVQFLNDRMELSLGLQVLRDMAASEFSNNLGLRNSIGYLMDDPGTLETDAFQMSFSGDPDELGQWRGYAANGMGCAIVTDALELVNVADVAGWVIYDRYAQEKFAITVLRSLKDWPLDERVHQVLIAAAAFMKHEGFRPEAEFRLIKFPNKVDVKFRESGDRLVPYVDFLAGRSALSIQKVIVGPGWQLSALSSRDLARHHVVQGISRLLSLRGLHATSIESSKIPYDPK